MACTKTKFREAMSLLGAAVSVITTDGKVGKCGYTGTAACSVSDDPATILVCLNQNSEMNKVFKGNRVLCVNILAGEQEHISDRFAGFDNTPMAARFNKESWTQLVTGSPVNRDALCALDCEITHSQDIGTHTVFFCAVRDIQIQKEGAGGLIYWSRQYHKLEPRKAVA